MTKGYVAGTHRVVPPEQTLARIQPHLHALEVTRLADVTGLDRLGIPVYCAVRPRGVILQSAHGKGACAADAKVSALMEALEHHHAEHPLPHVRRVSFRALAAAGEAPVRPDRFAPYRVGTFWSDDFVIPWVPVESLRSGRRAWVPASVVYTGLTPCLHDFTANGLASGNHLLEATLHALCEVVERDAISGLSVNGRIQLRPPACHVVRIDTLTGLAADLRDRLDASNVTLVLLAVATPEPLRTFWAVLIDRGPFSASSTVNVGYGTHLSPEVAAVRALTEAAQSRVCYIHGAREDLAEKMGRHSDALLQAIASRFTALTATTSWQEFPDRSVSDFRLDVDKVLGSLCRRRLRTVFRAELTRAPFDVPVVKVLVPGMRLNRRFF